MPPKVDVSIANTNQVTTQVANDNQVIDPFANRVADSVESQTFYTKNKKKIFIVLGAIVVFLVVGLIIYFKNLRQLTQCHIVVLFFFDPIKIF